MRISALMAVVCVGLVTAVPANASTPHANRVSAKKLACSGLCLFNRQGHGAYNIELMSGVWGAAPVKGSFLAPAHFKVAWKTSGGDCLGGTLMYDQNGEARPGPDFGGIGFEHGSRFVDTSGTRRWALLVAEPSCVWKVTVSKLK